MHNSFHKKTKYPSNFPNFEDFCSISISSSNVQVEYIKFVNQHFHVISFLKFIIYMDHFQVYYWNSSFSSLFIKCIIFKFINKIDHSNLPSLSLLIFIIKIHSFNFTLSIHFQCNFTKCFPSIPKKVNPKTARAYSRSKTFLKDTICIL